MAIKKSCMRTTIKGNNMSQDSRNPKFNPQAAITREIHVYDGIMELEGESLWERKSPGGKRGSVKGLSGAARRRMRKAAARVPKDKKPNFFTTTYQGEIGFDECKRHLDSWGKRMLYYFPLCFIIWRIELQKRGVPHFHMLIYGGPQILNKKGANKEVFEWMRKQWCEVTGQTGVALEASTRYEAIKSMRGVHRYLTKYLTKVGEENEKIPGRQWGIIGRARYGKVVEGGVRICRVTAEKWYEIKKRIIVYLVRQTGSEHFHYPPWWTRIFVYGEWWGWLEPMLASDRI